MISRFLLRLRLRRFRYLRSHLMSKDKNKTFKIEADNLMSHNIAQIYIRICI